MSMDKKTKVLIVDDHRLLRDGLAALLAQVGDVDVVGSVSSGEQAITVFPSLTPDVILMDIMMGGMTGIEATRWIKEQDSNVKIILISSEIKRACDSRHPVRHRRIPAQRRQHGGIERGHKDCGQRRSVLQ